MADEKPTTLVLAETPHPSTTSAPLLTTSVPPSTSSAPAVHGAGIWKGAEDLAVSLPEGIPIPETKQQYWDTLNRLGFRMQNQQESTTGPERPYVPWSDPNPVILDRPTPPLTRLEAETIVAVCWVWHRHGIVEALFCPTCFSLGRAHGMRALTRSNLVMMECRCGRQEYRPPMGTTDLATKLENTTHTILDRSTGTLTVGDDRVLLPTTELQRDERRAIRAYIHLLQRQQIVSRLFCRDCWNETSVEEDFAMRLSIDSGKIALACDCRMLVGIDAQ